MGGQPCYGGGCVVAMVSRVGDLVGEDLRQRGIRPDGGHDYLL